MRVAVFSTRSYDRRFLDQANRRFGHELHYLEPRLTASTARLAKGCPAVCAFTVDDLSRPVLERLAAGGTQTIALRSAGFNQVDLEAAARLRLRIVRVPAYSPAAVAEHSVGLMLALNRKIHRAYARVREGNFSLDGLLGFDFAEKTFGILGTGRIGQAAARILNGFGGRLLAFDVEPQPAVQQLGAQYLPLEDVLAQADVLTLHLPLLPSTHHLIDAETIAKMKPGVMLINTSRGGLIDTPAVIDALKSGQIGYLGLDVYEEEDALFFQDLSDQPILDDVFARLLTFPNVIVTSHQGFFTDTALHKIAETTLQNLRDVERGQPCGNEVPLPELAV